MFGSVQSTKQLYKQSFSVFVNILFPITKFLLRDGLLLAGQSPCKNDEHYSNTPGGATDWAGGVELCEHESLTSHPVKVGGGGGGVTIDG